jgi:hypothetical protein
MESTLAGVNYWRSLFLLNIGIIEAETHKRENILGSLDDLKASNLVAGPFRIALTKKPVEHLTYSGVHSSQVVLLLDLEQIFQFYRAQRMGVTR